MSLRNSEIDSLQAKHEHYGLQDTLEAEIDDAPDPGRLSSMRAMQAGRARRSQPTTDTSSGNGLPRAATDITPLPSATVAADLPRNDSDRIPISSVASSRPPQIDTRRTFPGASSRPMADNVPSSSPKSKTIGKRKRDTGPPPIPSEQQIFRGLHFYFFPNDKKNPARRMRIERAERDGAIWEQDFNGTVTHIIVDKTLTFADLVKFLKVDPRSLNVPVVSENYPAECIGIGKVIDPRRVGFQVKGYKTPTTDAPILSASERSPRLRPAGKSVQARRPETSIPDQSGAVAPRRRLAATDQFVSRSGELAEPEEVVTGPVNSTEEFDATIRRARELQHIPLDHEDEPSSRPSSSRDLDSDDEGEGSGFRLVKQKKTQLRRNQDTFQCMHKHTGSNACPNAATIAILQQMADYDQQIGDEWRARAYRKAISTLRKHPTKVWTREEAFSLPDIGERLATKIEEIAYTSRLRQLDNVTANPSDQVLRTFMQIYGVGFSQASKWVEAGYTSVDELREKATLNEKQRIGIDHFEDFNARIPHEEVKRHGDIVRKALQDIDPNFEVIVGGSYRRGAATSGDVDCMITRPNTGMEHIRSVVLEQLVPALFAQDFFMATLAATSREDGSKWHGASRLPSADGDHGNPWRRIDLLLVPSEELGAALIYFTGNDIFNRSLRLLASTKGMRLNQRGLFKDVLRGKGRVKLTEGTLVEGRDERRIFEVLGVPWRPPEHRIC